MIVKIKMGFPECSGFKCDTTRCLDSSVKCDGIFNCIDKTDEADCRKFILEKGVLGLDYSKINLV